MSKQFDEGVSALIGDLKASGQLDGTLVVIMGEFGRTVGKLSAAGGRTVGSTDATGANSADYGWSRGRDIKREDIEVTIYSTMGINWTMVRYDDPFQRGFEYVPFAGDDLRRVEHARPVLGKWPISKLEIGHLVFGLTVPPAVLPASPLQRALCPHPGSLLKAGSPPRLVAVHKAGYARLRVEHAQPLPCALDPTAVV